MNIEQLKEQEQKLLNIEEELKKVIKELADKKNDVHDKRMELTVKIREIEYKEKYSSKNILDYIEEENKEDFFRIREEAKKQRNRVKYLNNNDCYLNKGEFSNEYYNIWNTKKYMGSPLKEEHLLNSVNNLIRCILQDEKTAGTLQEENTKRRLQGLKTIFIILETIYNIK